jgi:hypothetical protein
MTKLKEVADDYGTQYDREADELPDGEQEFVDLHTIQVAPHPISGDEHFKALRIRHHPHKGGASELRNGERTPPKQGKSFQKMRMEAVDKKVDNKKADYWRILHNGKDVSKHYNYQDAISAKRKYKQEMKKNNYDASSVEIYGYKKTVDESINISEVSVEHDRYMRSHSKKAKDLGYASSWSFTHKRYGEPNKEDMITHHGRFSDAKKAAKNWAKTKGHDTVYVMENFDYTLEEVSSGSLQLKSGETVKLSESDASAINSVLASLSVSNKKKMEEELTRNKQSFTKIIQFARKAGE